MADSVKQLSSLFSGKYFVNLAFEFDYFTDSLDGITNQRIADWVSSHRGEYQFENVPVSSVPLVGDSFSVEDDFVIRVRHRAFDVDRPGRVVVVLMCQVIDNLDETTNPLEVQAELLNSKKIY